MAMTWTLRHMLDYLDDKLDPEQTRRLGQLIAEHEGANQLVERLRQITRKRRLSAPELDLSKPEEEKNAGDPNVVAAYLDHKLPPEETAELERLCQEADEYLAEVVACNQIVSVGDTEPVIIPPTARQRMYRLVQGREAIPDRPVKIAEVPTPSFEVDGEVGDTEGDLLLEPVWQRLRRQASFLLPVAAVLLVVVLGGLVYLLIGTGQETSIPQDQPLALEPVKNPPAEPVQVAAAPLSDTLQSVSGDCILAAAVPPVAVWPVGGAGFKQPDQRAAWLVSAWTASIASRPALPPNFLLSLGREELVVHAEKPAPVEPPPAPIQPPVDAVPLGRKQMGRLLAENPKEGLLLRRNVTEEWRTVRGPVPVFSAEKLLVLPGYRNDIDLLNKVRLTLVGTLQGSQGGSPCYETVLTVHASDDVDLDLTLERGRVVLSGKPEGETTVRLRYQGQKWEMSIPAKGMVTLEGASRIPPGIGAWVPQHRLALYAANAVDVRRGGSTANVARGSLLVWDSKQAGFGPGQIVTKATQPAWAVKPALAAEMKRFLAAFQEELFKKVQNDPDELRWIEVACNEAMEKGKDWPVLAVHTLGSLDRLPPVVTALDDPKSADTRRAAAETLTHWLGHSPQQKDSLRKVLLDRGYKADDAETLLGLLRRLDQGDAATVNRLLDLLTHNRLAIRQMAHQNLVSLLPSEKLPAYDPAAPPEKVEAAVKQLRKKVTQK